MPMQADRADLVITNADLPTVPRGGPSGGGRLDTVAVRDGRVLAVDTAENLAPLSGPGTRVVDAAGGALLPGINDAHLHFTALGSILFDCVDVSADRCPTWEHVAARLRESAADRPAVVKAHGWDEFHLGPGGADMLSTLDVDVPVVVFDQTGHQLLANEALVRAAGVTSGTPDPAGGIIGRRDDGSPSGLFIDAAMELAIDAVPPPTRHALRTTQRRCQEFLHSWGITSVTDPGIGPGGTGLLDGSPRREALDALVDLAESQELSMRMTVLMLFSGTGGATAESVRQGLASDLPGLADARGIDRDLLRIAGVKIFADGTPRSGTAWMTEPYGPHATHGHLVVDGGTDAERVAELEEMVRLVHDAGLQAGIHATGDAATRAAVDAVLSAQAAGELRRRPGAEGDPRHYVIHGAFGRSGAEKMLARMAAHRIGYCTNPLIRHDAGAALERMLGPERFSVHQPLATARGVGAPFTASSDAPVASVDWRREIVAMVTRRTRDHSEPVRPSERLGSRAALAAMTTSAAWQDHAERRKGAILPGHYADLCLLEHPWPDDEEIDALASNPITRTWSGGQLVHGSA